MLKSVKYVISLLLFSIQGVLNAQTDTEFWFVAPNIITESCVTGVTCPGGDPLYFRITTKDLPATVTITQPANPAWTPIVVDVAANRTTRVDVTSRRAMLENYPGGAVLNKGIYIQATNPVTVAYDVDEYLNTDMFSLKGSNALGNDFYVPFNNYWSNVNNYAPQPRSAIDIVATINNTTVTITPTAAIAGPDYAGIGVPFIITLDEGETYSCLATSRLAANHLGGTHITSTGGPVAVSIKDDAVSISATPAPCEDLLADQLVPVSLAGQEYIVVRGQINLSNTSAIPPVGTPSGERVFIMATQANTNVSVNGVFYANIGIAGDEVVYEIEDNHTHISADRPVMVFHLSGTGCEMGGALVPTIDGCTGSLEVSFVRPSTERFFLNLLTRDGAQDGFVIHYQDGTSAPIPDSWFESIGTTGWMGLSVSNKEFASIPYNEWVKITNSKDIFQLGIVNGGRTSGTKYGYFSHFDEIEIEALIPENGGNTIDVCAGDTVQLRSSGGISYEWVPFTYLTDPFNANPKAILPPDTTITYTVFIEHPCDGVDSVKITINSLEEVEAFFTIEDPTVCSPEPIRINNYSTGATLNTLWDWDLDDGGSPIESNPAAYLEHVYTNNGTTAITRRIQLFVENTNGCTDEQVREVTIYPSINAGFTPDIIEGCHPVPVAFTNTSSGNTDKFQWELGDGGSSSTQHVNHTYTNTGTIDSVYDVRLIAISPYQCRDTAYNSITVHPYLKASFAVDTFQGCAPLELTIYNNSLGQIDDYDWNFGDGTTSTTSAGTFTKTYTNTGSTPLVRTLRLVVSNSQGCSDTLIRTITVYPTVTADFDMADSVDCHPFPVSFTNLSNAAASIYDWDFDDGGSSSLEDPTHIFVNTGTGDKVYQVRLVSSSSYQCRDTASKTVRVHPEIKADFTVDEFQGCSPFNVTISNSSSGDISGYQWTWGDGEPGSVSGAPVLTHLYRNTGTTTVVYPLELVVDNAAGCTDTLIRNITVFPEVVSQFTVDTEMGCNPLEVSFTNQSNSVATSFNWDFDDGGSSSQVNPVHTFYNLGPSDSTYTVQLFAYSDQGCTHVSDTNITVYSYINADFTLEQLSNCTPFEVRFSNISTGGPEYEWDFGDTSDTLVFNKNPLVHLYTNPTNNPVTREIVLTVRNSQNCSDEARKPVTVDPIVHAQFEPDITTGCHPLPVTFTNQSTGAIYNNWDFGNGESSDVFSPTAEFQNFGLTNRSYLVRLTVTNDKSCTDQADTTIVVYPFVEADFTIEYTSHCTPFEVTMYNSSTNGQNYDWTFSTGTNYSTTSQDPLTRTFQNPSFTNSMMLTIELETTSPQGCISSLVREVEVYHAIEAGFDNITEGCHPMEVSFADTTKGAIEYFWDFGDNGSSIERNPVHTYTNFSNVDSVYMVELTVVSNNLCQDTASGQIIVHAKPKAKFEIESTVSCPPYDLEVENISEAGDVYTWNYGDGSPVEVTNDLLAVSHIYENTGDNTQTYTLRLDVESVYNCTDHMEQDINIYPAVIADFERDSAGCSPYFSEFTNLTLRAESYYWEFGDGTTSALKHPSHTYFNDILTDTTFSVKLTGLSTYGCVDSIRKTITVYPMPEVDFEVDPIYQYFPSNMVTLENNTNEGYWDFYWDFNDESSSTEENPGTHEYQHWGHYEIKLIASNTHCIDSMMQTIRIFPPPPEAEFYPSEQSGCEPFTVSFNNNSLWGETYEWDFDDGTTSSEYEPFHTFTEAGLYQVQLTVRGEGGEDIAFYEIEVYPKPQIDFEVKPELVMLPDQPIKVFNYSKYSERYLWDFGDGTTSTHKDTTHLYEVPGDYDIMLTAWTSENCVDSLVMPEAVMVIKEGVIQYPNAFIPNPNGPSGGYYPLSETTNEVFHPFYQGVLEEGYLLQIYNRWGELLFESNELIKGWDGYYNGKLCKQDVYVYKAQGKFINGKHFELSGDVTLLR